jgi:serine/threonine-protein kinase
VELEKNTSVTLFVSTGPAPRVLPELNGLALTDASKQLADLGLVVEVADAVFDDKVAKDIVMSWTVPDSPTLVAGGTVTKGTAVRLTASAGPEPRTVPDLAGSTVTAARAAVAAVQLQLVAGTSVFDANVPRGRLVSQTPEAGTTVPPGTKVTGVFSKGHAPVKIPAVTDPAPAKVKALLTKAGFVLTSTKGDPTLEFIGFEVAGKPVKTGQQFPYRTKVVAVYTAAPPAP